MRYSASGASEAAAASEREVMFGRDWATTRTASVLRRTSLGRSGSGFCEGGEGRGGDIVDVDFGSGTTSGVVTFRRLEGGVSLSLDIAT